MIATEQRFWGFVEPMFDDRGCWEWRGALDGSGYGKFRLFGKSIRASRLSWQLHFGDIPAGDGAHGVCVLHRCDNPACVNPLHLFLGSHLENVRDMDAKGRHPTHGKELCAKGHPYDTVIRRKGRVIARGCRRCISDRALKYYHGKNNA